MRNRSVRFEHVVLLATCAAALGCAPRAHVMADSSAGRAATERCGEVDVERSGPPVADVQSLAVYYARIPEREDRFHLVREGIERAPPTGTEVLAHITVCRRPAPDHPGAVAELKKFAAALGGNAIVNVRYTLVLSDHYYGGSRIDGWVYSADAARLPAAPGQTP